MVIAVSVKLIALWVVDLFIYFCSTVLHRQNNHIPLIFLVRGASVQSENTGLWKSAVFSYTVVGPAGIFTR